MAEASTRLTVGPSFLATAQDSTPEDPGERSLPGQHTLRRWTKSTEHLVYKHSRDSRRFSSAFQGDPREEEALLGADTSESVQSAVLDADALEEQIHHKPYGVQKIQAITAKLRHQDFKALYMALYLLMFTTALESSASPVVEPYFLSSFHLHSLLASMGILTNVCRNAHPPSQTPG